MGSSAANTKPLHGIQTGSPMVETLSQQYNTGEKPTVMLYTYIDSHAGTPDKNKTKTFVVVVVVVVVVFLILSDALRIQPWSQDRRNQSKSNRESEISRESRQKRTDKKVASKGHHRDKIENTNKNTQAVETNLRQPHKNTGKVAL